MVIVHVLPLLLCVAVSAHDGHHHHERAGPSSLSALLQVHHLGAAIQQQHQQPVVIDEALQPFSISNVVLAEGSRFEIAQRRNHEYLLSLNVSQLACFYTSAANLTQCLVRPPALTNNKYYVKQSNGKKCSDIIFILH